MVGFICSLRNTTYLLRGSVGFHSVSPRPGKVGCFGSRKGFEGLVYGSGANWLG